MRSRADDFYPEAMTVFQNDGAQTCMPQNVSSLVLYYNRDLFEEAGVEPPPAEGWKWVDMVTAATALTQDTDGDGVIDVYGLGTDVEIIRVAPFIWSNGGDIVDDPERPTRFTIGSLDAIRPIQAFLDLRGVHGVTPTDEEAESADFETRFLDGSLAMMMESRKVVPSFRTITDFEWDVAQLPVHKQPATILHSDAYCMTAAGEHKDQAWEFLEFALGTAGPADRDRDRPHRAVAALGGRVRRVPGPERAAGELAGVPRQHPVHPGGAPHRDVARDRGRRERAARGGVLRAGGKRRGGRAGGRDPRPDPAAVRAGELGG